MIRAGTVHEISPDCGEWIIVDIGFSMNSKSCGVGSLDDHPVEVQFYEMLEIVTQRVRDAEGFVNLLVEAPLSVAFNIKGNPTGRTVEKANGKTRYWYVGAGATVTLAVMHLIKSIRDIDDKEIRLFEGFVSFKGSSSKSDHSKDVRALSDVVKSPIKHAKEVIDPTNLVMTGGDIVKSTFDLMGLDIGVPPVIVGAK